LITRRNRYRPGTRYFSRGIDANGHVSNFVETEQFVLYDGENETSSNVVEGKIQLSYVQTRGSIPVYWAQVINSKYTPKLWLGDSRKSVSKTVPCWLFNEFMQTAALNFEPLDLARS
jgi:hypothetical protein